MEDAGRRTLRSLAPRARPAEEALAMGSALLASAAREGTAILSASVIEGRAVVLGAAQRAGRVVDMDACARAGVLVARRSSTGTAAYVGGRSILWSLALPDVAALVADATPRTLINRNVRPFLRALAGAGLQAHYFGREWIAVRRAPAALLGLDGTREGAVLLEVIAGFDEPIAIPDELVTPLEREVQRFRGRSPEALAAMREAPGDPLELAGRVAEGVAAFAGLQLEEVSLIAPLDPAPAILDPLDPIPAGLLPAPPLRVPIGWIDAASGAHGEASGAWLGGDVLAPRWLLADLAKTPKFESNTTGLEIPIEGAALSDLREALRPWSTLGR
ncbi:MAG: hypothetical protein L6Q76_03315 [Polyangiaceae bacterium]|nr:hypothetical protein [Polyangiaceae bacterium]